MLQRGREKTGARRAVITAVLLFLATADALPTPKLSWRRPTRHGSFERKHGISVRGGTLPLPDEVELAFDMKLQRFVKQNVKRWSSTVGLFAALCYFFPHLLVDFSSCWYVYARYLQTGIRSTNMSCMHA